MGLEFTEEHLTAIITTSHCVTQIQKEIAELKEMVKTQNECCRSQMEVHTGEISALKKTNEIESGISGWKASTLAVVITVSVAIVEILNFIWSYLRGLNG